VDYVLIWRTGEDSQGDPVTKFYRQVEPSILQQLEEGYELIYTSPLNGDSCGCTVERPRGINERHVEERRGP
jgi:hypothetical protein